MSSSVEFLNLVDLDSCFMIMLNVSSNRDFNALLCTCKTINKLWKKKRNMCKMSLSDNNSLLSLYGNFKGSVYGNYRLNDDQVNTLNHMWNSTNLALYVQLPMSTGKTAIGIIYCIERVKKLGGKALFLLPDKMMDTVKAEVYKLLGDNIDTKGVVISSRRRFIYTYINIDKTINTIIMDEFHTGESSRNKITRYIAQNANGCQLIGLSAAVPKISNGYVTLFGSSHIYANTPYAKMEFYGHTSTQSMSLPSVRYMILHTFRYDRDTLVTKWSLKPSKRTDKKYADELAQVHKLLDGVRYDYDAYKNISRILAQVIDNIEGRIFVIYGDDTYTEKVGNRRQNGYDTILQCFGSIDVYSIEDVNKYKNRRILHGTVRRFSEGVNLNMFQNLILIDISKTGEKVAQCIGRLQRTNNSASTINVYNITFCLSSALMGIVPRNCIDKYGKFKGGSIGYRNLTKEQKTNLDIDMSIGEMLVTLTTFKNANKMVEWLGNEDALNHFDKWTIKGYIGNNCEMRNRKTRRIKNMPVYYVDPSKEYDIDDILLE